MRNTLLYFLAALVIFPVMAQQQPEWQSQYAVGLNKLAPHTYVWPYQTVSDIRNGDYESSPYYMSLNGSWKFHWVKNPDNRPKDFYKPEFYTGGWADIQVPGNWERQGYGTAIYVNETYEFDDKLFHFKRIRLQFHIKRMKSVPTDVPLQFLPIGKTAVWLSVVKE